MIPKSYAELLDLPPETGLEEARGHCLRLCDDLRQHLAQVPPSAPGAEDFKNHLTELEEAFKHLENDMDIPSETTLPPPCVAGSPATLPKHLRDAMDLGEDTTAEEALAKAEAHLQSTLDAQSALKPKHPAHPRLLRDRARYEGMVAELREIVFTRKVDDCCDHAEEGLASQPPNRAKARDYLRQARTEAARLKPESLCLERLKKMEAKLETADAAAFAVPTPFATVPMSQAAVFAPSLPENPFVRLETLVDEGLTCLARETPDEIGAQEFFAEAEKESAGKDVPCNLRSRMQLFKRTLEQVRREAIHARVEEALKLSSGMMAQEMPDVVSVREKLELAASLLEQAPEPYFQSELGRLGRAIEEHEQWLAHRRTAPEFLTQTQSYSNQPEGQSIPTLHDYSVAVPPSPEKIPVSFNRIAPASACPPPIPEEIPPQLPASPAFSAKLVKRNSRALELGIAFLAIGLIGAFSATYRIVNLMTELTSHAGKTNQSSKSPERIAAAPVKHPSKPLASQPGIGEISVTVTPAEAELFTNGVSIGHPTYPVQLHGKSGQELTLEAALEGYSNATKSITFPESHSASDETLELQPKPALLVVHSEPPAPEVFLRKEHSLPFTATLSDDGIELDPAEPIEVSLEVPDYDPIHTNLPALKPGERKLLDFGKLKLQTATLRLKAFPPGANFSIIYKDRQPVPCGSNATVEGIIPRLPFQVIAEHPGYASASNSFLLKPREMAEYDFGKLKPLSASLVVTATPSDFDLKVAWDGASKDYGAQGRAAGLPPGKNLLVTVSATGREPASTNLVLEPGEQRALYFDGLQPAQSFVLLKSDPPGADVYYSVDGHFPIYAGVTDRIDGLPLGHTIEVTLHKPGYVDLPMSHQLLLAGDTLDFGRLTPLSAAKTDAKPLASEKEVSVSNPQATQYSAANIEKLLKEIDSHILIVRKNIPLTELSRRDWNEWINKVEAMHRDNGLVWNRLQAPLGQLRDLVNRTSPFSTSSIAKSSQ